MALVTAVALALAKGTVKGAMQDPLDHANPHFSVKQYLDGEGKWKNTTPCICDKCKQRREAESGKVS